ncbi:MAG: peptidase [Bdellovibrio sp.]|nr:MAG: peptidase [Bdellovibrio sp.]
MKKKGFRIRSRKEAEIVIDRQAGLVFSSEKELFKYFQPQIELLEKQYSEFIQGKEESIVELTDLEDHLELTLEEPQEIWHDPQTFKEFPIFHFIRPIEEPRAYHVAVTYVSADDEPTFIFLHFVTTDLELANRYRRSELIYDRSYEEVGFGALDGDALSEGDPLAIGLFIAMLKVRAEKDIPDEKFRDLGAELREDCIENADEIWRNTDLTGHQIVTFIKDFPDHEIGDVKYVVVTQEDPASKVHSLLFSFPTNDETLVDRYRHGENLQAEEVIQESSH